MSDDLCDGFVPQVWKKERCKKCFRTRETHGTNFGKAVGKPGASVGPLNSLERLKKKEFPEPIVNPLTGHKSSWRQKVYGADAPKQAATASTVATTPSDVKKSPSPPDKKEKSPPANGSAPSTGSPTKIKRSVTAPLSIATVSPAAPAAAASAEAEDISSASANGSGQSSKVGTPTKRRKFVVMTAEVSLDDKPSEFVKLHTEIMTTSPPTTRPSSAELPHQEIAKSDPAKEEAETTPSEKSFATAKTVKSCDETMMSKSISYESLASTLDSRSMVTAPNGSVSTRGSTPTENLDESQAFLRSIKAQLEIMENKCAVLEQENSKLKTSSQLSLASAYQSQLDSKPALADAIKSIEEKLQASENLCQDYRDENTVLKCELRELQELVSRQGSLSPRGAGDSFPSTPSPNRHRNGSRASRRAESRAEEILEENVALRQEVEDLKQEIEELQDQYREEEIEEFRDLQRELEQTAKNCRILQFKLRKTERMFDQSEADRQQLHDQVKALAMQGGYSEKLFDSPRIKELEGELRVAKEVSVRLHNELEVLDDRRCKMEDEIFFLKERVRELETREKLTEAAKLRSDARKLSGSRGSLTSTDTLSNKSEVSENVSTVSRTTISGTSDGAKELQDAVEREMDLRDQLKFAEEDLQAARRKLSDLEIENEGLMQQLAKLTAPLRQPGLMRSQQALRRSYSEGQEAQIELELAEHEVTVLKSRVNRLEGDKDLLNSQISLLEKEVRKTGGNTSFTEPELHAAAADSYYKQKIKMLEEELDDVKTKLETCMKTEVDQDLMPGPSPRPVSPTRLSLKRAQRIARTKSAEVEQLLMTSTGADTASTLHAASPDFRRHMHNPEQEAASLRQRIAILESENEKLSEENKRLQFQRTLKQASENSLSGAELHARIQQMETDIHRFISRIAELEREKEGLFKELMKLRSSDSAKQIETDKAFNETLKKFNLKLADSHELRNKVSELLNENSELISLLKAEQTKSQEAEAQLAEYKQIINQSENQKLISMATKVEILTNQLKLAQDRIDSVHRRLTGMDRQTGESKYEDILKERIEKLEKDLAVEKAKSANVSTGKLMLTPQNTPDSSPKKVGLAGIQSVSGSDKAIGTDVIGSQAELETCRDLLNSTSVEIVALAEIVATMEKQLNKEDVAKASPAPAELVRESSFAKPVLQLRQTLASMQEKLQNAGKAERSEVESGEKTAADAELRDRLERLQQTVAARDKLIADLREQLDYAKQERAASLQECALATDRLLQTEERWNKELEKLRETYENQIKDLKFHLVEAERSRDEKSALLKDRCAQLADKAKRVAELEARVGRLDTDLKTRHKDLELRFETERKRALEYQTKYAKLEELYDNDREKLSQEKERFKQELGELRKRNEEIHGDFEKYKTISERQKTTWAKEKQDLEALIRSLQADIADAERKAGKRASELANAENKKLLTELSGLKRKMEVERDHAGKEKAAYQDRLDEKQKELDSRMEDIDRLKRDTALQKQRIDDQKQQLEETRRARDDSRDELSRWQQSWTKERSDLNHKLRQEEKVQQAEVQALQLKYESRIKVMEDTTKRFQAQLTQTRRERDHNRDLLQATEKKFADSRQANESDEKELRSKILKLQKETEELEDLKIQLEQSNLEHKALRERTDADAKLSQIEKHQLENKLASQSQPGTLASRDSRGSLAPSSAAKASFSSAAATTQASSSMTISPEQLLAESVQVANDLRQQLDSLKSSYDGEMQKLRKSLEKNRVEWAKDRSDMQRKIRELQENTKILEIDRRNLLSTKDETEQDRLQVTSERDSLLHAIHDGEIHQLANKYKLDKVADLLAEVQVKMRSQTISPQELRDIQDTSKRAVEQLLAVREDMAKSKTGDKPLEATETIKPDEEHTVAYPAAFVATDRLTKTLSHDDGVAERFEPISNEPETDQSTLAVPTAKHTAERVVRLRFGKREVHSQDTQIRGFMDMPRSVSTDTPSLSIEQRIAEIRMRSPSPSAKPRKITNYPEAPPNIIFNVKKGIEYDAQGKRHWKRRSLMKRSASYDPSPVPSSSMMIITPVQEIGSPKLHVRSNSAGERVLLKVTGGEFHSASAANSHTDVSLGSASGSAHSPKPLRSRTTFGDMFNSLRRPSKGSLEPPQGTAGSKRSIFGSKRSKSIETSDTAKSIGVVGVTAMTPAVDADILKSSQTSVMENPFALRKSGSASSTTKFFGRFLPRRAPGIRHQGSSSVDSEDPVVTAVPSVMTSSLYGKSFAGAPSKSSSVDQLNPLNRPPVESPFLCRRSSITTTASVRSKGSYHSLSTRFWTTCTTQYGK